MKNKLRRTINIFKVVRWFVKALDCFSKSDREKAIVYLDKILVHDDLVTPDVLLLKSWISLQIGHKEDHQHYLDRFFCDIKKKHKGFRVKKEDREYLYLFGMMLKPNPLKDNSAETINRLRNFDLSKVSKSTMRHFPPFWTDLI